MSPQPRWIAWISPLFLVVLWELAVATNLLNRVFVPPPSEVAGALWDGLRDGSLIKDTLVSSQRILLGFLLGAIPATLLGMWCGLNRTVLALVRHSR